MATYLLGGLTKSLFDPKFIPVGILARKNEDVEVRVVSDALIPNAYRPESGLSNAIISDLENVLREAKLPSEHPTNLYFTSIKPSAETGTLSERADNLYKEFVLPRYSL